MNNTKTLKQVLNDYEYDEFVIWKICPLTGVEVGVLQGKNKEADKERVINKCGDIEVLSEPKYEKTIHGNEYLEITIPGNKDNFYSRQTKCFSGERNR